MVPSKRSVYRKLIWTKQYLSFHGHCPIWYKRGIIRGLFNRISRTCTSDTIEGDVQTLIETLINNGCSLRFINHRKGSKIMRPENRS